MNDSEILFGLQELQGIGWKTIARLASLPVPLSQAVQMKASELAALGIPRQKAEQIKQQLTLDFIRQRQALYAKHHIGVLTISDEGYPPMLREIAQPPWVLYYKGRAELFMEPAIAVVGTRNPTVYGRKMAYRLSRQLAEGGFVIVSGLARGIDGISHLAALESGGATIGVTAGGLDFIYPKEHAPLYRTISEEGLIVSEFPLGTQIRKGMFPLRNRIIAGLSSGTVVVEGGLDSGSLITAEIALEESRDVFAVPGQVTSPKSAGALTLLKDGAKIVISAQDIFEEYAHKITLNPKNITRDQSKVEMSRHEEEILQYIAFEPVTFDEILRRSGSSFGHLHSVLLSLLIKNKIEQLPGSRYIRTDGHH